jgi:hypothetical protein
VAEGVSESEGEEPVTDDDDDTTTRLAWLEYKVEELEARVTELGEMFFVKDTGTWTVCAVCGASTREGRKGQVHRSTCAMAMALDLPRENRP